MRAMINYLLKSFPHWANMEKTNIAKEFLISGIKTVKKNTI